MKNIVDVSLGSLLWWLLGYGFAYGKSAGGFIGGEGGYGFASFGFETTKNSYRDWFFQWAFSTTAATIVSGALAERTKFFAYFIYSCFISDYPIF